MNNAFYYIMKDRLILRLEEPVNLESMTYDLSNNFLDSKNITPLNQEQANYRVAIFRDEIVEWDEYENKVLKEA